MRAETQRAKAKAVSCVHSRLLGILTLENKMSERFWWMSLQSVQRESWPAHNSLPGHLVVQRSRCVHGGFFPHHTAELREIKSRVQSPRRFSEEAVLTGNVGETAESVGAAGGQTGTQLRSSAHRVGHHLPGELWIDVLKVSRASLGE